MTSLPTIDWPPCTGVPLSIAFNPPHPLPVKTGPRPGSWPAPRPSYSPPPEREARLYFTIGAQRSGKTTQGRRWLLRNPDNAISAEDDGFPRHLWDTDFVRLEIHGDRYNRSAEPVSFMVKRYAIGAALRAGHDVVVAGTHTSKASIRRILEIRRDAIPVLIDTPVETCKERAVATGQEDLLPVIERLCLRVSLIKDFGVADYVDEVRRDMDKKVPY